MKSLTESVQELLGDNNNESANILYHFSYDVKNQLIDFEGICKILEEPYINAKIIERICQSTLIFQIEYVGNKKQISDKKNEVLNKLSKELKKYTYFIITEIISDKFQYIIKNPNQSLNKI